MPKLNFILHNNKKVMVQSVYGLSILEIAHKNNITDIEGICNGSTVCGTCHIIIDEKNYEKVLKHNPISPSEALILDTLPTINKYSRLACQITFTSVLNKQTIKIFNGS